MNFSGASMRALELILLAAALSGCVPAYDSARIMCSTAPIVRVSLGTGDGVIEGEEFSVWRSESRQTGKVIHGSVIYRVGKIRILRVEGEETSLAEVIKGSAQLGDRVTKWLISDNQNARVLQP